MRVENENESSHNKIESEMRVFLYSLNFEIEMRVSQKSGHHKGGSKNTQNLIEVVYG